MKQIEAVILGYGDRSYCYSKYAMAKPDELKITGVIDVNPYKLKLAKERFGLADEALYVSLDEFLGKGIKCDVVINGTMDEMHYETSVKLLKKGYNVLLEKPVTGKKKELLEIRDLAEKNGCKVVVCHVLRYTPFYRTIKEIIDSGELGKITDMQLNEHVWHGHFVNSYVRGKWRSEKECGSGLLLAKCCHDTDLMCWLNNSTEPTEVSSFGARAFYTPANAPEGSAEYCYECACREQCMFDAEKFELTMDCCPQYTWAALNKPYDRISEEEKREFLRRDVYGKCVYKTDMDIVDRQCVSVNFANGSIGTLNMVGGASKAGRHIHIVCEYGEIVGYIEDNKVTVRRFNKSAVNHKYTKDEEYYTDEEITPDIDLTQGNNSVTGHYGGDYYIMKDLVRFLNGEPTSVSTTVISDSVNSHLICYAAELSRKEKKIVDLKNF